MSQMHEVMCGQHGGWPKRLVSRVKRNHWNKGRGGGGVHACMHHQLNSASWKDVSKRPRTRPVNTSPSRMWQAPPVSLYCIVNDYAASREHGVVGGIVARCGWGACGCVCRQASRVGAFNNSGQANFSCDTTRLVTKAPMGCMAIIRVPSHTCVHDSRSAREKVQRRERERETSTVKGIVEG
jgi:hypothetical protein